MKQVLWPKAPPALTEEQLQARESFMRLWHEQLPKRYGIIEAFNQGFPARLPLHQGARTLEVGAGLGGHLPFEALERQDYYALELRQDWCDVLRSELRPDHVICGDISERQPIANDFFDRVIAIHVLEHIRNLPAALDEIHRILKVGGFFDVVLPCEGGLAYSLARKISAERLFRKNFKMDYGPIIANEHVSTIAEIIPALMERFSIQTRSFFPFQLPSTQANLVVGYRFVKGSA